MIVIDKNNGTWEEKVNFVDANNVLVGYDMAQDCCEEANWFISTTEDNEPKETSFSAEELMPYVFDQKYFVEVEPKSEIPEGCEYKYSCLDEGGMVRFRLVADGKKDLFLHLFNSHNGYYGHGFKAEIKGIKWQEGSL